MRRYNQFSHSNAPLATFPSVEAPPIPSRVLEKRIALEVDLEHRAVARRAQYYGFDSTVCLFDFVINPFVAGGPDIVNVVTFRVPEGRVLEVQRIAVQYNEPIYHATDILGWRPTVDNGQIPHIGNQSGQVSGYLTSPLGDFHGPMEIEPFFVQSNSVFDIKVFRSVVTFHEFMVVSAWVFGRLHKPIGGA